MILPWAPIVAVDILGSSITLAVAFWCARAAWLWHLDKRADIFRDYVFLLTLAFAFFAVSRSVGHLVKQVLVLSDLPAVWAQIAPYSGAVNSLAFVVIFAFGVYFERFRRVHDELEHHKDNLEVVVEERTLELTETNHELEAENRQRREAEERLAVTLRSIGDGVVTTDTDGRVAMMNPVAGELCGWDHGYAVGRPLAEIFQIEAEETGAPLPCPSSEVLSAHDMATSVAHARLVGRDGRKPAISYSAAPICRESGDIIGVVLVFRDVSKLRRMEKELLKRQKLESVGVLAGGIAHDFNNILAGIIVNLELAKMQASAEDVRPLLHEAKEAAFRATGMTNQLLTFAKGGAPVPETLSLAEILRASTEFVLRGSNVRCEMDIDDDLRLVDVDRGQMSQVVQNLILNARQAMPEGGVVSITARNRHDEGGEQVEVVVADQGPGIAASILDNIFDPYFSTRAGGSGLGLAVCHSIITRHGGTIEASCSDSGGARLTFTLPTSKADKEPPARDGNVAGEARAVPARVLIMDDEVHFRTMVAKLLAIFDCQVEVASDGAEAIRLYEEALAKGERFDVVLMDLTIPGGMSGKSAVKRLRALDPSAKVVVASGYSHDPVMANYREYGFCGALAKPFRIEQLAQALQDAQESQPHESAG